MKKFLSVVLIGISAFSMSPMQAQTPVQPTVVEVQNNSQTFKLDTAFDLQVNDVKLEETNVCELLSESRANTFIDSIQVVAKAVADPEFKSLLLQTVQHLNRAQQNKSAEQWLSWIGLLAIMLSLLAGYAIRSFIKPFYSASALLLMVSILASSCSTCQFINDYNVEEDKVIGCVECHSVSKTLNSWQTKIFRIKQ